MPSASLVAPAGAVPFVLLPAISPIHDPAAMRSLVESYAAPLRAMGAIPHAEGVTRNVGPIVVLVVTGGTERLVLRALDLVSREPVLLVAHPGHNSLPASLEILARVQQLGGRGEVHYLGGPDDTAALARLAEAIRGLAVRRALRGARVGLVGDPSDWLVASSPDSATVREVWGPTVVPLALDGLLAEPAPELVKLGEAAAREFRTGATETREPADADLAAAGGVLATLRRMVQDERLDAVTVRCFDLVVQRHRTGCLALAQLNDDGVIAGCEGDLVTTVAMLWLNRMTGALPWMANPSRVDRGRGTLLLAHCTIARGLVSGYQLRSHFESGLGAAVQGTLPAGPVTLVRLGGARMERLRALDATLVGNTDHADLCRTQVEIEIGRDAIDEILSDPLGNHMVLVPGHHAPALRRWHAAHVQ